MIGQSAMEAIISGAPKQEKSSKVIMVLPNSCLSGARRKKLQLSDWMITSHAASLDGEHHFDVLQTVDQVAKIFKNNSKLKIKTKTLVEPEIRISVYSNESYLIQYVGLAFYKIRFEAIHHLFSINKPS